MSGEEAGRLLVGALIWALLLRPYWSRKYDMKPFHRKG